MRIVVAGGGPAGLCFAYLMKRSFPDYQIRVVEQNPQGVTFGFGVVLSGQALRFIGQADPELVQALQPRLEIWQDQHISHRGECVVIDGSSYSAIARLALLDELQRCCRSAGVEIAFERRLTSLSDLAGYDVIVGADGANSLVRDAHADAFGTRVTDLENWYAWYGVELPYAAHTLTFVRAAGGVFCGHHYRYTSAMSTFVPEVDAQTWHRSGLSDMNDDERRRLIQEVFAEVLQGRALISNRSLWRRWRLIRNDRWYTRNIVLLGDALRTAHPSIGSGTRLAMEDSVALWRAFQAEGRNVAAAFSRYESERRPPREKLDRAAEQSIAWFEAMDAKMALPAVEFAHDYLLRTGLMTEQRLAGDSPIFMQRFVRETHSRRGKGDQNDRSD